MDDAKNVREAVVAGTWYPGSRGELENTIRGFLEKAEKIPEGKIRALVAPHAGYPYSGQVAAHAYKQIEGAGYRKVIVLAPTHKVGFHGASVTNRTHYRTPLGDVTISAEAKSLAEGSAIIRNIEEAHGEEHSLEIQLPFLQYILGNDNFRLVPLVLGTLSEQDVTQLADLIAGHTDEDTLIVASSDLSHYHPYDEASQMDAECIASILSLDTRKTMIQELCGIYPVLVAMNVAKRLGWKPVLLNYANSGDVTGDYSGVVGYAAIAFYETGSHEDGHRIMEDARSNRGLNGEQQKALLKIAREALETYVRNGKVTEPKASDRELKQYRGAFVTLEAGGQLRGCIGHLGAVQPLYLDVRDNAINAAVNDPRFPPVEESELDGIEIEVSVLSEATEIESSTPEELLEKITEGRDGIILEYRGRSATYLPQVWEVLPEKEEFLESLCMKANLPAGSWQKPEAKVFKYNVQAFKESEHR